MMNILSLLLKLLVLCLVVVIFMANHPFPAPGAQRNSDSKFGAGPVDA